MKWKLTRRWSLGAAGAVLILLLSVACVQLAPRMGVFLGAGGTGALAGDESLMVVATAVIGSGASANGGAPTQATPSAGSNPRQPVPVRRGSIADVVQLNGRVAAAEEATLTAPKPGRVETVSVKAGQAVEQGQVLLEADSKDTVKELTAARARLDVSSIQLQQAQVRQRAAVAQGQFDRQRQQDAAAEAEANLRRAEAEYERVKAGPTASEREAAQAVVTAARAALEKAQLDADRLKAGPPAADVRVAEQQVEGARLGLQRAEADLARLKAGPNPDDVRAAERDVTTAQNAVDRAQADLDALTKGPDPFDVRAAEREVQRAQNAVAVAEAAKVDETNRAAHDAAVASARLDLQAAQERLAKLREPAKPAAVDTAKRTVDAARADLNAARTRLDAVRKGPDSLALDAANATVNNARVTLQNATDRLNALKGAPPEDVVAASSNTVTAAQGALNVAQARLDELNSHPTPAELRDAQDKVAAARAALDRARAGTGAPAADSGAGTDVLLLQRQVEQDRAQVASLEQDLAAGRLLAPYAGVVSSVLVRRGDPMDVDQPVLVLAKPGTPIIRADAGDKETARLQPGQKATVQLEGGKDAITGSVTAVTNAPGGAGRVALVSVEWPADPAQLGVNASVAVTVQEKQNALLVPQKAVRSAGARRYVQYMDGVSRRIANVEVGIANGDVVEILSGLTEGQLVVVAP